VERFTKNNDLNLYIWPHQLESNIYDIGVVVSFGYMIDADSIQNCKYGMINVHPSLLPRWRGSTPIQKAILKGDTKTGVTIVCLTPSRFDVGDILIQESIEIKKETKAIDLYKSLATYGSELLIKCILNLQHYQKHKQPQSQNGVSFARKLKKSDGLITWSKMTSHQVDRRFRAFDGFIDIYCHWIDGTSLKLKNMVNLDLIKAINIDLVEKYQYNDNTPKPGLIIFHKKRKIMCIKCADMEWVAFETVNLKGYSVMSAEDFYNGFLCKFPKDHQIILA